MKDPRNWPGQISNFYVAIGSNSTLHWCFVGRQIKDVFRFMLYHLSNPRILLQNRWVLSSNTQVAKLVFRAGLAFPNIHDISRDSHFCV